MTLWDKLKSAIAGDAAGGGDTPDTDIATAVLLYEIACADMEVADAENQTLRNLLANLPGVDADSIETLIARAAAIKDENVSLHEYVGALNEVCSFDDKRRLVHMIWEVAYADGVLDAHEEHMVRRLSDLLFVPHSVFIQQKLAVQEARGVSNGGEASG